VRRSATPERLALASEVAKLRERGLVYREIADRLGLSGSYVAALAVDPDGSAERARKRSYRGRCENCGRRTDGSNGPAGAPTLCMRCYGPTTRYWTRETVIDAIVRFAKKNGRPPKATEWTNADPKNGYPATSTIFSHSGSPFLSWADAIEAAGFERPRRGKREGQQHWDGPDDVIDALRVAAVDGLAPISGNDSSLRYAAVRFFGSWRAAVAAAGLTPRTRSERYHRWNQEEIVAEIRRRAVRGLPPFAGEDLALLKAATRYFGSWSRAVRKAGFEPYGPGASPRASRRREILTRREATRQARRSKPAARAAAPS
jgi:hypothetical protein